MLVFIKQGLLPHCHVIFIAQCALQEIAEA